MTAPRNPDRLIRTYLIEDQATGHPEVPDRVYSAIRLRIEQTRQRATIGSRGVPDMNKFVAIGLGAAAVVAVLLIGSNLLGSSSPPPGGAPSASAEPSEAAPSVPSDGSLPVGSPFVWVDGSDGAVPITITVPTPGWRVVVPGFAFSKNGGDPPDGAAMLSFALGAAWSVPGDACRAESTLPDTPSATVDEFVAALAAQASRDASAPVDITLDGHAGKSITLHVPGDIAYSAADEFTDCEQTQFCTFVDPSLTSGPPEDACARSAQGPGQIDELWIVVVDGNLVIIDAAYYDGTPDEVIEEQRAIVDSITFE
jgi:hypothetical protein